MSKKGLLMIIVIALLGTVMLSLINIGGFQPVSGLSGYYICINEVMPLNKSVLADKDGNFHDWVEFYNAGDESICLKGYGLSDDLSEPGKWIFPDIVISPKSYLVIFASGKDYVDGDEYHTNFRIDADGEALVLSNPQGSIIEEIEIQACDANISYCRDHANPTDWFVSAHPSPGHPNNEKGAADFEATRWVTVSDVILSEVMADNASILQDEDGAYSDWVEITNNGTSGFDLTGFALSNDRNDLFHWRFPQITLLPGQNLIVFCSGKNKTDPHGNLHTNFKINRSTDSLFFANSQGQIVDYVEIHGLPEDSSLIQVSGSWEVTEQPTPGYPNTPEGYEDFLANTGRVSDLVIWEVMSRNEKTLPDEDGNFHDWVEIRNTGNSPINLADYWLSDNSEKIHKWRFPEFMLDPGDFAIVFLSSEYNKLQGEKYLYANFGLSAAGEILYLSDANKTIVQKLAVPMLTSDISYGRLEGKSEYSYFTFPTPGRPNNNYSCVSGYSEKPVFSIAGGLYADSVSLTITVDQDDAVIYYTTDGSEPGLFSPVYTETLTIDKTTVVRAVSHKKGYLPSPVVTHTYILDPQNNMAVVSIATDPENLWSEETGIYTFGHDYEPEYPYHGANFWQDWEKPAHIEFFETDGSLGFSMDVGISIHGEYTQALDQKSFGIDARKKYGSEFIHYSVFSEKPYTYYQSIVLRNSGQDNGNTKLRDVLISQLMKETGLDYQAYRPAVLYLNGEYWGFYTLRESTDKHFLHTNNPGIDFENLDIVEGNWRVHQGDLKNYRALLDYIESNDLSVTENYEYVKAWMDVDNFIDYQIAVIYGDNVDNGNIKFWRERAEGSKWRWILFDFDMAFRYPEHDMVSEVFNPEGTGSEDMFSTVIQMGLLQNAEFRDRFLRRLAYHMNNTFEPQRVCALIDQLAHEIEPEMHRNYTKWNGSMRTWNSCIEKMKNFFMTRPEHVKEHIQQYFNLTDSQMYEYGFH